MHQDERIVDVLEVQVVRDVGVDLHLAVHVCVHEARHLRAALEATEGCALPLPAGDELEGPRGDLLASTRNTDDDALPPADVAGLQRGAHHLHVARAVEGVVHAEVRHADNLRLHSPALGQLLGVDGVCGAPLLGELQLGGQEVHGDDLGRAGLHEALHHAQAHGAHAEDGGRGTALHLSGVPNGAPAGGDAAAQEADPLQWSIPADLRQRLCMQDAVLCEGAGPHEVIDGLALIGEARLAVASHDALPRVGTDGCAEVDVWPLAELARSAVGLVARDHVVPWHKALHTLADALHNARGLVAQDARKEALRVAAIEGVGVRVAQRHGNVLHADLALQRRPDLDLHNLQRLLGLEGHRREALNLLAGGCRGLRRAGVDRGCGQHACVRAPAEDAREERGVELQVVLHEARDEIVRVVVSLLQPEGQGDALLLAGSLQRLWLQLVLQEAVGGALVNEEPHGWPAVLLEKLDSVVLLPSLLVVAEVEREGLLAPGRVRRVRDRGEGGNRLVRARVLQRNGQGAVAAHAVAEDARLLGLDGQESLGELWELLGDVVQHVVVRLVLLGGGVQVEAGA
mmetsp:Transcript_84851/g.252925  ORF Transcript_84851/g.252925 Transcript_84851/m.252925 type:complete len:572 (+) Transcript_84851:157-1872(+)